MADSYDCSLYELAGYLLLITGVFLGLVVQFLFYFRLIFLKSGERQQGPGLPVSILLPVRNEEDRIRELLLQLLSQEYESYEVVVIDNHSEDNTRAVAEAMAREHSGLRITALGQDTRFSGKMTVNLALKAARYERVVFLSPDTDHIPPDFLRQLDADAGTGEKLYALYYGNYLPQKGFFHT
ncbi:MAG: glycosyltransferase family 2 protein, partial [Mangrovibacterium sp.]